MEVPIYSFVTVGVLLTLFCYVAIEYFEIFFFIVRVAVFLAILFILDYWWALVS